MSNELLVTEGRTHQEVILLLAGCLFAPFSLLVCLALFGLAECRHSNNNEDDQNHSDERRRLRRSRQRQALLLVWLAAAAALAGASGANFGAFPDWQFEAAPGDQLAMQLGSWAGLCGSVSIDAAKGDDVGKGEVENKVLTVELFNPGLASNRWLTQPINRTVSGRINAASVAAGLPVEIAWELPVPGVVSSLTVTATFRHRLRLLLHRQPGLHRKSVSGMDGGAAGETLHYGEWQLVDQVQAINSVTLYNVSQWGRLTMLMTCLEDAPGTLKLTGNNNAYTVYFKSVRYTVDSASQWLSCRLSQLPCIVDNPPSQLVLQLAEQSQMPDTNRRHKLVLRCERRSSFIAAATGLLVCLVIAPCALVLVTNALLATSQCPIRLPSCQQILSQCMVATGANVGAGNSVKNVDEMNNNRGNRLEQREVRFQL